VGKKTGVLSIRRYIGGELGGRDGQGEMSFDGPKGRDFLWEVGVGEERDPQLVLKGKGEGVF